MQGHEQSPASVIALAGRRVDAADARAPRFPLANVPDVRRRISELLVSEVAETLVCSAACGADLVALEEAERLGLRSLIILPFAPERFRNTSVVDRPGDWGPVFDRLISTAEVAGNLVVIEAGDSDSAYIAANGAIVREAQALARASTPPRRLVSVVAWEGKSRGEGDATENFRQQTLAAGFKQYSVLTL